MKEDCTVSEKLFYKVIGSMIAIIGSIFVYTLNQQSTMNAKLETYQGTLFQELKEIRSDIAEVSNDVSEINGIVRTFEVIQ